VELALKKSKFQCHQWKVCILIVYTFFPELKDQPKRLALAEQELLEVQRTLQLQLQNAEQWLEEQKQPAGGGQLRHMLSSMFSRQQGIVSLCVENNFTLFS
jgi:hypothetical protein